MLHNGTTLVNQRTTLDLLGTDPTWLLLCTCYVRITVCCLLWHVCCLHMNSHLVYPAFMSNIAWQPTPDIILHIWFPEAQTLGKESDLRTSHCAWSTQSADWWNFSLCLWIRFVWTHCILYALSGCWNVESNMILGLTTLTAFATHLNPWGVLILHLDNELKG